ncbi:T9SS type A sorting domain-containing protein [bacterium]|nr:T9SS type A sorting domain-containing protein [bacterium]
MRLARTTLLLLTLSVAAFLLRSGGVPTLPAERAHPGTAATDLVSGTADLPPGMTAKDWALVRARGDGKPLTDEPDQFAKILHDMRVPSDRTESEYRAGYRVRELQRAAMTRSAGVPLPWVERGPGNVAGRTRGVIVDPDDPSGATWIIGTVGGGVWRTTNEGATWTNLTPDLPNLATSAIAMAESNHDVLYVGTGEAFFNIDTVNGDGMFKSTDRGATWVPLASTLGDINFNNVARIVVDPSDADVVVAGTTTGRYKFSVSPESQVMRSTDGGATWTEVFVEPSGRVQQIIATPGNFNVLFAGVYGQGILKSTDAGVNWAYSNGGITDFTGRFELAISPVNTSIVYASAQGSSHSELWASTDAGASWTRTTTVGFEPNWLGSQGWYDNTIACDPVDTGRVYVGGIYLWQLDVNLSTFSRTPSFLTSVPHVDQHNLVVFDSFGTWRLLNANDGGLGVASSNASGWSRPIHGLITTQFYGVDKRPGGSAYAGGMQDNNTYFSGLDPNALSPWTLAIGGDGYETSWHFNDPGMIIGGSQYNGLARTTDGGVSWQGATSGLGDTGGGAAPFITKIGKTNDAPDLLFAVGASGVWRSTDFGGSWSLTPLFAPDWKLNSFLDVRVSRANPDVVWAGAYMDNTNGRIHRSTDQGLSFTPVSNYAPVTMGLISGLSTHPTDDQTAYVLFSYAQRPKILRTTDGGGSWTDISGFGTGSVSTNGFPDVAVYDLLVRPDDPNILWAGTEIGLFESTDNGGTWSPADNGLPTVAIWQMTHVEDEVVLATHGRGIWSVSIPAMTAGQTYAPLVERLYQPPAAPVTLDLNLRSAYDSTHVLVDAAIATTLGATAAGDSASLQIPVISTGTITVKVVGYRDGTAYPGPDKLIDVFAEAPRYEYANDFNVASSDFAGNGFTIGGLAGFTSNAIHSPHPYADETTLKYQLVIPIVVASDVPFVEYDDVAIIEPGDGGSVFGDSNFWDYVLVEGSLDGLNWTPIAPGYDAGLFPDWTSAYNSGTPGNSGMFHHHAFDLTSAFSPGDVIFLRFRLYADQAANGWGWTIDNLEIQTGTVSSAPAVASSGVSLAQNSPNPFRASTDIAFSLAREGRAELRVYDVAGRLVQTLVDGPLPAGPHTVRFERPASAPGVYFYKLTADGKTMSRKMVLLK